MSWNERFHDNYIISQTDCWVWVAGSFSNGYGQFRVGDKKWRAHRLSWSMANGDIPEGMMVLHKCDVKECVNPDHLYLGTHTDNMRDRSDRERQARGEMFGSSKLTTKQVLKIKEMLGDGVLQKDVAQEFNVSSTLVSNISLGLNWSHV